MTEAINFEQLRCVNCGNRVRVGPPIPPPIPDGRRPPQAVPWHSEAVRARMKASAEKRWARERALGLTRQVNRKRAHHRSPEELGFQGGDDERMDQGEDEHPRE